MKIEDYEYSQLCMESFAAESRGFGQTGRPKLTKFGHNLAIIWPYFNAIASRVAGAYRYDNKNISYDRKLPLELFQKD